MIQNIPVPIETLKNLIERHLAVGVKFDKDLALCHLMLDWATGVKRSYADYAMIWQWSKSQVGREMRDLYDTAESLLLFRAEELEEMKEVPPLELFPGMPVTKPVEPQRRVTQKYFGSNTWQFKYSVALWQALEGFGVHNKMYISDPAKAIQNGAKTFDMLHRIDGHSKETIRDVVKYLLKEDDFWIVQGNFNTVTKLREKVGKGQAKEWLFDKLLNRMNQRAHESQRRATRARNNSINEAVDAADILRRRRQQAQSPPR